VPYDDGFPKHFQGLAIRIEDELVVRQDDYVLLSANAPREIVDVEACCQRLLDAARPDRA
jgi:intermediate cleaving peptidase 55